MDCPSILELITQDVFCPGYIGTHLHTYIEAMLGQLMLRESLHTYLHQFCRFT
jgi:hypothetical protein